MYSNSKADDTFIHSIIYHLQNAMYMFAWSSLHLTHPALPHCVHKSALSVLDSQWEFAVWHPELNPVLRDNPGGGVGEETGGRFTTEVTYVYLWLIHVDVWQKKHYVRAYNR